MVYSGMMAWLKMVHYGLVKDGTCGMARHGILYLLFGTDQLTLIPVSFDRFC